MSYILSSLAKQLDEFHMQWDQYLPFTQFVYNTSPCLDSTEFTPAFLVYGRHPRTPLDQVIPNPQNCPKSAQNYVSELLPMLDAARVEAEQTLNERKGLMKKRCTERAQNCQFRVGETVYLHSPVLIQDQSRKLASPWHGPFYVIEKLTDLHVRLRAIQDNKLYPQKVHVNRLKHAECRYTDPPDQRGEITDDEPGNTDQNPPDKADDTTAPSIDDMTMEKKVPIPKKLVVPGNSPNSAQSADTDDDQAPFYEIEKILYKRKVKGKWLYRVKWLSYPSTSNSYVPFEDLSPECQTLVTNVCDTIPIYKK